MSTLGGNNCSQFYDNVIRELSMIVNNEKIISHNNPVLALEIKWSYKENKGFIKIRKKIPLIYWTK